MCLQFQNMSKMANNHIVHVHHVFFLHYHVYVVSTCEYFNLIPLSFFESAVCHIDEKHMGVPTFATQIKTKTIDIHIKWSL